MANVLSGPNPLLALMLGIANGLPKLPSTVTSVTVLNQTYTLSDYGTKLASLIGPYQKEEDTRRAHELALKTRDDAEQDTTEFVSASVAVFKAALGRTSANLELLGIEPDKIPAPLTIQQKAERAAKGSATRKARGTLGPKQKAKIHGTVPEPTPPSPTPPSPTPPSPTPPILMPPAGTTPKTGA